MNFLTILLVLNFLNFTWPITQLKGTSVSINSPSPFKQWGGLNEDETDDQVSKVEKYIMNYGEIYNSFIYVTTLHPGVKFNLAKSVEGGIRGTLSNKYWHEAGVTERKEISICGVRGILFTIKGKMGEYNAQTTSIAFQKGNKCYMFVNTFGTSNPENLLISNKMFVSIK